MKQITFSVTGPWAAFSCLVKGFRLLGHPGLRHFVWIPLLINVILYSLGSWLGVHYFSAAMDWLIPGWLDWLRWLLWPLFALLLMGAVFFTFTLVTNLIGAPFYSLLAEQVEKLFGQDESTPAAASGSGLWSGLASEWKRLAYFASRGLPLLLLFPIPGVNLLAPFLSVLYGAWSLSLEYMAYPLEARGLLFAEQRALVRQRRLDALAFGGGVMLGLAIPVLNVFVPPAAVIGATLYFLDKPKTRG